jgi:hypothetical protein
VDVSSVKVGSFAETLNYRGPFLLLLLLLLLLLSIYAYHGGEEGVDAAVDGGGSWRVEEEVLGAQQCAEGVHLLLGQCYHLGRGAAAVALQKKEEEEKKKKKKMMMMMMMMMMKRKKEEKKNKNKNNKKKKNKNKEKDRNKNKNQSKSKSKISQDGMHANERHGGTTRSVYPQDKTEVEERRVNVLRVRGSSLRFL